MVGINRDYYRDRSLEEAKEAVIAEGSKVAAGLTLSRLIKTREIAAACRPVEAYESIIRERDEDPFLVQTRWYADLDLCEELIEQGSLAAAKKWLTKLHQAKPDAYEVQELLLDVLFRDGLSERDFEWIEEPSVVRLNRTTNDRVHLWIQSQGGLADIIELRFMVFWGEYLCFEEEALAKHLKKDSRFSVESDGIGWMIRTL